MREEKRRGLKTSEGVTSKLQLYLRVSQHDPEVLRSSAVCLRASPHASSSARNAPKQRRLYNRPEKSRKATKRDVRAVKRTPLSRRCRRRARQWRFDEHLRTNYPQINSPLLCAGKRKRNTRACKQTRYDQPNIYKHRRLEDSICRMMLMNW
jgi:hypothetical protein